MRRPVFAANWKMNVGPADVRGYLSVFLDHWTPDDSRSVIFFPPALSLCALVDALRGQPRNGIRVGVQNIWTEERGPFTGENSALHAREAGAEVVLVGHSERRHVFGETDAETAKKCAVACGAGLVPILCVGETLAEREAGRTETVVVRQLRAGFSQLNPAVTRAVIIAYEPVWAIGTGKNATPEDASMVHTRIRETLRDLTEVPTEDALVLYGGSVNKSNAASLLAAPGVDGLLVGGASLDAVTWSDMCRT